MKTPALEYPDLAAAHVTGSTGTFQSIGRTVGENVASYENYPRVGDPADRSAVAEAERALRRTAGNLYVNDKPTGSVVGHQPCGGARASGTNDKADTVWNLIPVRRPAHHQGEPPPRRRPPLPAPREVTAAR